MNKYIGLFGFELERKKRERVVKFQKRCIREEHKYIKDLVDSQIEIPDGYNQLVWSLSRFTDIPIMGHRYNLKDIEKNGFKPIFKNVKIKFELE